MVRIGIADLRGDGRPDYAYKGWVLYADTVQPARLPASGGPIVIHGMGFNSADTVLVGGQPALVTSISPNEITAIAPAAAPGVSGSVDVEVDDLPVFYAATVIGGGLSYDSGSGDALTLVTAPANTVPMATPIPFTVTALGPDMTPAGGVTVIYSVVSGSATLACGQPVCAVTASGDGRATINATAADNKWSVVTASLTNGSTVQAGFAGGTPATLTSLTPQLSLAAGATFTWTVQALVVSNGAPAAGQSVSWQSTGSGITTQGTAATLTNASGVATRTLTVGPLAEGQTATINACLNGTSQCVAYTAFGARPEYAVLQAVSGTTQSIADSAAPAPITTQAAVLIKHHGLVSVAENAPVEMPADSARKHHAFQIAAPCNKILNLVAMRNTRHVLFDDGTVVENLSDVVAGSANELDAARVGRMVRPRPCECRQK